MTVSRTEKVFGIIGGTVVVGLFGAGIWYENGLDSKASTQAQARTLLYGPPSEQVRFGVDVLRKTGLCREPQPGVLDCSEALNKQ